MEEKKTNKQGPAVPLLVDKNSDFNLWYDRLKLKLDAKGLWDDFCAKPEVVPDPANEYKTHLERRKQGRWKIDKALGPELSRTVSGEETPYGVLNRLRKIFVGATKLSLVHQLRSVMEMKYKKSTNLFTFIEQLKEGFTKLENMGLPLPANLKPYILVMVLDDTFENVLRPYLVHSLAENEDLNFDKLVELLESTYIETERREMLEGQDQEQKTGESALAATNKGGKKFERGPRKAGPNDEYHHCHRLGHFLRDCKIYKKKQQHGWRYPLPCRSKKDFYNDDRDPTRRKQGQKRTNSDKEDNDKGSNSKKQKKNNSDDEDAKAKAFLTFREPGSDSETALMTMDVRCLQTKTEENEWIVDSAATRHMTNTRDYLVNYRPISAVVQVGGNMNCT